MLNRLRASGLKGIPARKPREEPPDLQLMRKVFLQFKQIMRKIYRSTNPESVAFGLLILCYAT